jgi:hypothetical protein
MMQAFDPDYVRDIVRAARSFFLTRQMTRKELRIFCKMDLNAGYKAEVDEAERQLLGSA